MPKPTTKEMLAIRKHLNDAARSLANAALELRTFNSVDTDIDPQGIAAIMLENMATMTSNIESRIRA